ncbi:MAG: hypothetical protein LUD19_01665 [Clostridia bacterium]|nr:hypothetical protein [Clostridia bacterium]
MKKVKEIIVTRGIGYYLTVIALVFAIVVLALCSKYNGTEIVSGYYFELDTVISCFIAGVVLAFVSLVLDVIPFKYVSMTAKPVRYIAYLIELYAILMFVLAHVNYCANVLTAIDGNSFTSDFISLAVFIVLTAIITLIAAVLNAWAPWIRKQKSEVQA